MTPSDENVLWDLAAVQRDQYCPLGMSSSFALRRLAINQHLGQRQLRLPVSSTEFSPDTLLPEHLQTASGDTRPRRLLNQAERHIIVGGVTTILEAHGINEPEWVDKEDDKEVFVSIVNRYSEDDKDKEPRNYVKNCKQRPTLLIVADWDEDKEDVTADAWHLALWDVSNYLRSLSRKDIPNNDKKPLFIPGAAELALEIVASRYTRNIRVPVSIRDDFRERWTQGLDRRVESYVLELLPPRSDRCHSILFDFSNTVSHVRPYPVALFVCIGTDDEAQDAWSEGALRQAVQTYLRDQIPDYDVFIVVYRCASWTAANSNAPTPEEEEKEEKAEKEKAARLESDNAGAQAAQNPAVQQRSTVM